MSRFKKTTFVRPNTNDITPRSGYILLDENKTSEKVVYEDSSRDLVFTDIHEIDGKIIAGDMRVE